ncbi:glycosyl hydrolase family 28-related protein [Cerasicoccus frondis]|uniref:glycosyl hydrolase family 28-related protein n=1 Tax=Cerasicoccus frondis TaxID=490090 RepID=UPI0028526052|nr:glycosyl hydrolase family 28-related protein [Cerasicoccus frondis]
MNARTPSQKSWLSILCGMIAASALFAETPPSAPATYSQLWGENGELWSPVGRLPDFSFAGYHFGEDPIPDIPVVCSVKDFGAKGDGVHDDTQAFIDAIAATDAGVIEIPAGRYVILDIIWIRKPNVVLRGAGPDQTILYCPLPLETVKPHPSKTGSGESVSEYSWAGGFLWMEGRYSEQELSPITSTNERGDREITVESTDDLNVGDVVCVKVVEDEQGTLMAYLHDGAPGRVHKIRQREVSNRMFSRISEIRGNIVVLERALTVDLRPEWKPQLMRQTSDVKECGIEDLAIEFPITPTRPHHYEYGYNGIEFRRTMNCWVRNVRIKNADSSIILFGRFCTVDGLVLESERPELDGVTGHHGVTMGYDCVLENFDIQTRFIHDITVDTFSSGNVVKNGKGVNLSLDHHRRAPYQNLYTNLDLGKGTETWTSGGAGGLGNHAAARNTFWRLIAETDQTFPPRGFGPEALNFIGLQTHQKSILQPDGIWFEAIPPAELEPADLHAAQLKKRLGK